MANKYIIHGATFNGDGSSSAEATSNGGVGAWNTITYFEGTAPAYGTLAAGDVVYIRSKDASNANISIAKSGATVNLGSASATETSPITWIFDSGDVWSGVDGTVTYTMSTGNLISTRNYNNIYCKQGSFSLVNSYASYSNVTCIALGAATIKGIAIDMSAQVSSFGGYITVDNGTYVDLQVSVAYTYDGIFNAGTSGVDSVLVNPKITAAIAGGNVGWMGPVFNIRSNYAGCFTVIGGEISGSGMLDGRVVAALSSNSGQLYIYGFKYPANIPLSSTAKLITKGKMFSTGCDGSLGTAYWDFYYAFDSRSDGYYPTLNAMLENSTNTGWSFKVYPHSTTKQKPALITTSKMYTQNAATKTVTLDLLWPNTMAAPTKDAVFITVVYTDNTTGAKVTQNTYSPLGGTLDASTAAWSTTTYGPVSFDKYKLQITTSTAVKKDTEIMVVLSSSPKSANSSQVIFVDPDVALS